MIFLYSAIGFLTGASYSLLPAILVNYKAIMYKYVLCYKIFVESVVLYVILLAQPV